jgi:hypothetical protein
MDSVQHKQHYIHIIVVLALCPVLKYIIYNKCSGLMFSRDRITYYLLYIAVILFLDSWDDVRLYPLSSLLSQSRMIDDEYGAVGGMRIGKGNRSTWRKPAPVILCQPQIPHDLTWAQTRASAVGSQ